MVRPSGSGTRPSLAKRSTAKRPAAGKINGYVLEPESGVASDYYLAKDRQNIDERRVSVCDVFCLRSRQHIEGSAICCYHGPTVVTRRKVFLSVRGGKRCIAGRCLSFCENTRRMRRIFCLGRSRAE
jgi:hypothetical protein